jgi:hypothetical protein
VFGVRPTRSCIREATKPGKSGSKEAQRYV